MKSTKVLFLGIAISAAVLLSASMALAFLPIVTGLSTGSTTASSTVLSWTQSVDAATVGYKIFQDGSQIATVTPTTATSLVINNLMASTTYVLGIRAYNLSDNSDLATTSVTTLVDAQTPSVPVITSATPVSTSQINLLWAAATDNVSVAGYNVYRDDALIATTTGVSSADTGRTASTTYKYNVSAYDASGNVSATSSSVSATTFATSTLDTTPPSQPTNLSAFAVSPNQINLYWSASSDNIAVAGYKIFRDSTQIATTSNVSYPDTGLATSTTYSYFVQAYDAANNVSSSSATRTATTLAKGTKPISTTTPSIKVIGNEGNGRLINLRSNAKIKVLVYGGASFNVKNLKDVSFGGAPAVNNWRVWYNRDRHLDRIFEFRVREMKDLAGLASTTATSIEVHFKATTAQGQAIDLIATVKVKNLKGWRQDRQHEREEKDRQEKLREAKKRAEELAKELKSRQQEEIKKQQQLLKEKQSQFSQNIKQIRNDTQSVIKNLQQNIKDIKSAVNNIQKGKNGNNK